MDRSALEPIHADATGFLYIKNNPLLGGGLGLGGGNGGGAPPPPPAAEERAQAVEPAKQPPALGEDLEDFISLDGPAEPAAAQVSGGFGARCMAGGLQRASKRPPLLGCLAPSRAWHQFPA